MVLVAAVREGLRHAGAHESDVVRFTEEALARPEDADHVLEVAESWIGAVDDA